MSPTKLWILGAVGSLWAAQAALAQDMPLLPAQQAEVPEPAAIENPVDPEPAAPAVPDVEEPVDPVEEAAAEPADLDVVDEGWEEAFPEEAPEVELVDSVPAAPAPDMAPELPPIVAPEAGEAEEVAPPLLPGVVGYDSQGREGRIHIVQRSDTLWDISAMYLGTPWVWPSIWQDNGEIDNPHLIHPGDRIWITDGEMRRISAEEADLLMAGAPAAPEPVELAETNPIMDEIEPEPVIPPAPIERGSVRVAYRESTGLISVEELRSSASIVSKIPERVMLSQEDDVYIGLGESDTEVGEEFTIFRTHQKVFDPDTGELLGYHVEVVGWVKVLETFPETALAKIRMSTAEVTITDRLIPREPLPVNVPVQASPQGVEGKISYFPDQRVLMAQNDFVYLNRGTLDGLEVGSPLEVYRPGHAVDETARRDRVDVPDRVVAKLLVVRAAAEASVALVRNADGELNMGDRFRGTSE